MPTAIPNLALAGRGLLYVELHVRTMSRDAHSGGAHALPSAAWRLVRALATLKDNDERVLIDGFYDDAKPMSDVDRALMEALPSVEANWRELFGVETFVNGMTGTDLRTSVFNPTCNIAGITTGYQGEGIKTVDAATASAKIDFRLVPDQDPEDIFRKLRAHLDAHGFADIEVTRLGQMWPHKSPPDDPFVQLSHRATEDVYGKSPRVNPLNGAVRRCTPFRALLGASR